MNRPYIEFRKQRDFSSILNDTFGFIRNEFKPFIRTIFNIAGPAIVVFLLSLAAYNYVAGDLFNFSSFNQPSFNSTSVFVTVIVAIIYLISAITAYILTASTTLFYIKSYVDRKGSIDAAEIKSNVLKSFWSFFGTSS